MQKNIKKTVITIIGGFILIVGLLFILLPGPAVIFVPVGLALLSLEYQWAKVWLKRSQKYFRQAAVKADRALSWMGRKARNKFL